MKMITNVLLDLDETILDFLKTERVALQQALRQFGIEPTEEVIRTYSGINQKQWQLLEQGLLTRDRLRHRRFELLLEEYDWQVEAAVLAEVYEANLAQGFYYKEGAKGVLEQIYQKYNLYLLSNGTSVVQHSRIAGAGLKPYFKGIYISEDMDANKPDLEYFRRCFADMEQHSGKPVVLEETVMVGDSLTSDIQGGINAGVRTIWLNAKGSVPETICPDYEIQDISELPGLLEEM
jgi:2-haloacid dehalogenase